MPRSVRPSLRRLRTPARAQVPLPPDRNLRQSDDPRQGVHLLRGQGTVPDYLDQGVRAEARHWELHAG